jgi:transglutaminase-like putative cysteine protease
VTGLAIDGAPFEVVHDSTYGNQAARLQLPPTGGTVTVRFDVERKERSADLQAARAAAVPSGYARWLGDDALVKIDDRVRRIAADVTRGKPTPIYKARAIYDYVESTMKYVKKGEGWGRGSLVWACDMKYGNCTDFHALMIGLLRASGIPARFQIGYSVPESPAAELSGYHCWADFYIDGAGWIPVDASEGWKHPGQRDYFFGHHDANRVALSTGRDLVLPGMRGAPLNYFVFPYAEAEGQPVEVTRKTRFTPLP